MNQALKRPFSRRKFLRGTTASAFLLAPPAFIRNAGPSKLRKVKFQLAGIPSRQYAFAFAAKELGYWSDLGLDVQIDQGYGSGNTAKSVARGQFDLGEASFANVAHLVAKGTPLIAMGTRYQKSPMGYMALKKTGLKNPKDLEGKYFCQVIKSRPWIHTYEFARVTGFDTKKTNWRYMPHGAFLPSLLSGWFECEIAPWCSGRVDGIATYYEREAPQLMARGVEFDFIFLADHGLNMLDQVFIAKPSRWRAERKLFHSLIEGALKGVAFTYAQPEKSMEIALKHVPLAGNEKDLRRLVELRLGVATALGISPLVEKKGIGWIDPSVVKRSVDEEGRYFFVNKIARIESLYTNEFVGRINLKAAEWAKVRRTSRRYLPS